MNYAEALKTLNDYVQFCYDADLDCPAITLPHEMYEALGHPSQAMGPPNVRAHYQAPRLYCAEHS